MSMQDHAITETTARLYRAAWDEFVAYCARRGVPEFPATMPSVLNYLVACAHGGLKYNALRIRLAAIRRAHVLAGLRNPAQDPAITAFMRGVRRTCGYPRLRRPLDPAEVRCLVETIAAAARTPADRLRATRDTALVLLCFLGPLRRKHLRAMRCENLVFASVGVAINGLRRDGRALPIRRNPTGPCAVAALEEWLRVAHLVHGPVFRGTTVAGELNPGPLSIIQIARRMHEHLRRAGLEALYGTSSLRQGWIAAALEHDVPRSQILRQTELSARTVFRTPTRWRGVPPLRPLS